MELDEKNKERINNYFNSLSSEELFKLAVNYDIREAIEWGQTKGQELPIHDVSKCVNCDGSDIEMGWCNDCDDYCDQPF